MKSRRRAMLVGVADQAIVSGSSFAFNIALARILGLEQYGAFCLAWMTLIIVSGLQDALIVYPMLSIGPRQPVEDQPAYLGMILIHGGLFALFATLLLYAGLHVAAMLGVGEGLVALAFPLSAAALTYLMQNLLRYYFFTSGRALTACFCDAVSYLGKLLACLSVAYSVGLDAGSALLISSVASGVTVVLGGLLLPKYSWNRTYFGTMTARHWKFGRWMAGSALIRWADNDWYVWIAGGMLGVSAVGVLRVAQNLTNVLQLFLAGLESVVAPQAANEYGTGGREALYRYLGRAGRSFGAGVLLLVLVMVLIPEQCLWLLYGEPYASYGEVLRWAALAQGLAFFIFLFALVARTLESTRVLLIASSLTVLANVLTGHQMIGHFGLEGAAFGLVIGRGVTLAILCYALYPRRYGTLLCVRDSL